MPCFHAHGTANWLLYPATAVLTRRLAPRPAPSLHAHSAAGPAAGHSCIPRVEAGGGGSAPRSVVVELEARASTDYAATDYAATAIATTAIAATATAATTIAATTHAATATAAQL